MDLRGVIVKRSAETGESWVLLRAESPAPLSVLRRSLRSRNYSVAETAQSEVPAALLDQLDTLPVKILPSSAGIHSPDSSGAQPLSPEAELLLDDARSSFSGASNQLEYERNQTTHLKAVEAALRAAQQRERETAKEALDRAERAAKEAADRAERVAKEAERAAKEAERAAKEAFEKIIALVERAATAEAEARAAEARAAEARAAEARAAEARAHRCCAIAEMREIRAARAGP